VSGQVPDLHWTGLSPPFCLPSVRHPRPASCRQRRQLMRPRPPLVGRRMRCPSALCVLKTWTRRTCRSVPASVAIRYVCLFVRCVRSVVAAFVSERVDDEGVVGG